MTLVNPFAQFDVSQGWLEGSHGLPGGGPAIDYAIPFGTVLRSPTSGRVSLSTDAAAGRRVAVILDDGRQIVLCHNSKFIAKDGDIVEALDELCESGNSGLVNPPPTESNPQAGSHLHTFGLNSDGSRWNWTLDAASPASLSAAPLIQKEDEMILITAPGVHPALIELGAFIEVNNDEKLRVATKLAVRRVDLDTKREYQVARALALHARTAAAMVR
jgi:murein DD-endopeptidase MepM/ murein hydrolase activator NlpD